VLDECESVGARSETLPDGDVGVSAAKEHDLRLCQRQQLLARVH
jgi:hypothetical protein